MKRNSHLAHLSPNYLFLEIQKKKKAFLEAHPEAKLISLSIGDTSEPLLPSIANALSNYSKALSTEQGYSGYGSEEGTKQLRTKIAETLYQNTMHNTITPDEIFISDGAKCDIGRWQLLFGTDITIGLIDPCYPVYSDGSAILGVKNVVRMPLNAANNFFPDLKRADLIYFCSPNNPTGSVATKEQLTQLVHFAKQNRSILLFDAAYASYIQDSNLPKSIYEIEGAKEVAIEVGSFSKMAGFSGVRLGWSVVPKELTYECGYKIKEDFKRIITTIFNGASNIAQMGAITALESYSELQKQIQLYLKNAVLLKQALLRCGYRVDGGEHAPYLWVSQKERSSVDLFNHFLEKYHIVTTPGNGFGVYGEGYVRFSSFGSKKLIEEAAQRLSVTYPSSPPFSSS